MAIVRIQEQPEMFRTEMYDAVNAKMGTEASPPPGLLAHTLAKGDDGVWRIIDIWESREASERFGQERLMPALREVMSEQGMDVADLPETNVVYYETHDVLIPAGAAA